MMTKAIDSAKYGHIKEGDRVAITIVTTVASVGHYESDGEQFTSIEYESGLTGVTGRALVYAAELPEQTTDGTTVFVAHTTPTN